MVGVSCESSVLHGTNIMLHVQHEWVSPVRGRRVEFFFLITNKYFPPFCLYAPSPAPMQTLFVCVCGRGVTIFRPSVTLFSQIS